VLGLEAEVPLVQAILILGEAGDFVERQRGQRGGGVPALGEGRFEGVNGEIDVDKEVGVGAVETIVRLARRRGEGLLDEAEVQVQEEATVKQETALVPTLGVAAELEPADGEVCLAAPFNGGVKQRSKGIPEAFQDEAIGGADAVEVLVVVDVEDEGIVQDTRALQDGAAAGAATEHGDGVLLTEREIGLGGGFVAVAEDDKVAREVPEAEEFVALSGFAEVEEDFVTGEVFLRGPQGKVAELHVL